MQQVLKRYLGSTLRIRHTCTCLAAWRMQNMQAGMVQRDLQKLFYSLMRDCITFVTATSQSTDGSLQPQMGTHINDW